jgi:hypothetical protein
MLSNLGNYLVPLKEGRIYLKRFLDRVERPKIRVRDKT